MEHTGTAEVVSGAGAKCMGRGRGDNEADMEHYGYGFALIDATTTDLAVTFHDYRGRPFWKAARRNDKSDWRVELGTMPSRDVRTHCDTDAAAMSPATSTPCRQP
jgi:hypothetical protein